MFVYTVVRWRTCLTIETLSDKPLKPLKPLSDIESQTFKQAKEAYTASHDWAAEHSDRFQYSTPFLVSHLMEDKDN